MTDTSRAPSQCPSCSGVDRHVSGCSELVGVWYAHGDEVCDVCGAGFDVGDPYVHVEHTPGVEVIGEQDRISCLGCAAHAAIGSEQ